jgi:hypothetical protein
LAANQFDQSVTVSFIFIINFLFVCCQNLFLFGKKWKPKISGIQLDTLRCRNHGQHVFLDRSGILLIDFLPCGKTINADVSYATFKRLWRSNQNC